MLELLVNEDKEAAQELFHEIVVEKSRDIYESLLEDEADVEEATDEEVDESEEEVDESDEDLDEAEEKDEDDEEVEEGFSLDEFEVEADPMGGDATDDMMSDLGMDAEGGDDMGDEEGEEGDMEDRVEDLEDALDDLKAEFEKMMAGDDSEEGADDMDMGGDEEGADDMDMGGDDEEKESFAFEADDEEVEEKRSEPKSPGEQMREYVEKVSATMGDNGANTKSVVANPNKMGGTASNLAQAGTEAGVEANKGQLKGNGLLKGTPKDMNTKNVNVPGAKGATKMSATKGHGAEKKGSGDNGANTKPVIGK